MRLRGGYAVSETALAYVEAGPALANVHYASNYWDAADETENVSIQSVKLGFSLGAGSGYALTKNLSLKAEYVFTRIPSVTPSAPPSLPTAPPPSWRIPRARSTKTHFELA